MKVIVEKASWARHLKINRYVFHYFHLLDTSAGGLLVPGGLIHTGVKRVIQPIRAKNIYKSSPF